MAGKRQPTELLIAKGKKHLTLAEIELRKAQEIHAPADKVKAPPWLTDKAQKRQFNELAAQLIELKIMTNLDCEALARTVKVMADYVEITKLIDKMPVMKDVQRLKMQPGTLKAVEDPETGQPVLETVQEVNEQRAALLIQQDRMWKQCRQGAADFGLTIASRCRLVAPKTKEDVPQNKFLKYAKGQREA